ncbi:MAG: Ig-like domain-containing protein [Clostridia bacterium]|nr:Ig-like domain-containing protein [Clostridia bacterium]
MEEGITEIPEDYFYGCPNLQYVQIPTSVYAIGDNAFGKNDPSTITIYCNQFSYAEKWAREHGYKVVLNDTFDFAKSGIVELKPTTMLIGDTLMSPGHYYPAMDGLTPVYTSDNPAVVAVDTDGTLTAVGLGTANVTLTVGGKSQTALFTVYGTPAESFAIPSRITVPMGQQYQFEVSDIQPVDADLHLTWSLNAPTLAEIDEDGLLTTKNLIGTFVVTATDFSGAAAQCVVQIVSPVTSITLDPKELIITDGIPRQLTAAVNCGGVTVYNQYVGFSSSNEEVAMVDENGLITPIATGFATITAYSGKYTDTCTVCVIKNGKCWDIHHYINGMCIDCGETFDISGLTTLTIPNGITRIEPEAFTGNNSEVIIVQDRVVSIGAGAFTDCPNLEYIFLPAIIETTLDLDAIFGTAKPIIIFQ